MKQALFVALLVLLAGCTVVGHERVEGWPAMQVIEHHVPHHVMRERCAPYTPPLMSPEACAEFHFASNQCHIWFSVDFPPPPEVVRHERLHCRGYDHVGDSVMRDALARYLAAQQAATGGSASAGPSRPTMQKSENSPRSQAQ